MSTYNSESYRFPSTRSKYFDSETTDFITDCGNLIFQLKQPFLLPSDILAYVQLSEMVILNNGHSVDGSINTISFFDVYASHYRVKPGNYNANTLVSAFNSSLLACSAASPANTMTVSYNNLNSLLNFQSSYAYNGTFVLRGSSSIIKFFSFLNNTSITSAPGLNASLISKRHIDLTGNNCFYFTANLHVANKVLEVYYQKYSFQ